MKVKVVPIRTKGKCKERRGLHLTLIQNQFSERLKPSCRKYCVSENLKYGPKVLHQEIGLPVVPGDQRTREFGAEEEQCGRYNPFEWNELPT